jgi:hypothetical protein
MIIIDGVEMPVKIIRRILKMYEGLPKITQSLIRRHNNRVFKHRVTVWCIDHEIPNKPAYIWDDKGLYLWDTSKGVGKKRYLKCVNMEE